MAFLTFWHLKEPRGARAKKSPVVSKIFKAAAKILSAPLTKAIPQLNQTQV